MTYGVFLFVGGGGVSGRGGISDGFVGRSGAVEIGSDNSDDGEDNNGDLLQFRNYSSIRFNLN